MSFDFLLFSTCAYHINEVSNFLKDLFLKLYNLITEELQHESQSHQAFESRNDKGYVFVSQTAH